MKLWLLDNGADHFKRRFLAGVRISAHGRYGIMTTEPASIPTSQSEAAPAPNPFVGIPGADLARDALALLLLLVSLAMPWDISATSGVTYATGHIEVIIVTLLSVLSLSLAYLVRMRTSGTGLSGAQVGLIRAAANVPYAVVVAIYLILDISKVGDKWFEAGGIGAAAVFGLTGAALAGMPRQIEADDTSLGALQATVMRLAVVGLGGLWVVVSFINLINVFADWASAVDDAAITATLVIRVLIVLVPLGLLTLGLVLRSAVARTVTVAGGVVMLGAAVIDWYSVWVISGGGVESVHRPVFGVIAFVTLGALASSHLVRAGMRPMDDAQRYLRSASMLLMAQAALVGATAIITVVLLATDNVSAKGKAIGFLFALVVIGALAGLASVVARTGRPGTQMLVLALTGGTLVVGIVAVVLVKDVSSVSMVDLIYAFGLPLATLVLLLAPGSVRARYNEPIPVASAPVAAAVPPPYVAPASATPPPDVAPPASAEPPAPAATPAPPAPETVHPRAAEAASPETPVQALFEIASNIPELRAAVAANPSTYPDLLTWLGTLGDPAVDAALKARGA